MGLKGDSEIFFITSAAQTLSIILLHTFWSVIFFNACDNLKYPHICYVVSSHMLVSCITLLNKNGMYSITLPINYLITIITGLLAFKIAGGSLLSFKKFITCK